MTLPILFLLALGFLLLSYLTSIVPRYHSYNIPATITFLAGFMIAPAVFLSDPPLIANVALLVGISMTIVTCAIMVQYYITATYRKQVVHWA